MPGSDYFCCDIKNSASYLRSDVIGRASSYNESSKDIDTYNWKNSALVQREVSDVVEKSKSKAKFRITSNTVMNKNSAPTDFDKRALAKIKESYDKEKIIAKDSSPGPGSLEYHEVVNGKLMYARGTVTSNACLKCHTSLGKSPSFIQTNALFNKGGGFGYKEGNIDSITSVVIPIGSIQSSIFKSINSAGIASLILSLLAMSFIMVFVFRKIISPVDKLTKEAEKMATTQMNDSFSPELIASGIPKNNTNNEVHKLTHSIVALGQSMKYMYKKIAKSKNN